MRLFKYSVWRIAAGLVFLFLVFGPIYIDGGICKARPNVRVILYGKTETSFTIRWNVDYIELATYYLQYKIQVNSGNWTTVLVPKNKDRFTLSNLHTGTVYEYRLYSCYAHVCGEHTKVYTVQTGQHKGNQRNVNVSIIVILIASVPFVLALVVLVVPKCCNILDNGRKRSMKTIQYYEMANGSRSRHI